MMNLFLVVTSTQFQITKRREAELNPSLNSSYQLKIDSNLSCWEQLLILIGHSTIQYFKNFKYCKSPHLNKDESQVNYSLAVNGGL
jgi:hypothetical protein